MYQANQGMDPNRQLHWQQYYGHQQPGGSWGGVAASCPSSAPGGVPISGSGTTALPPQPPKEEAPPPPLPSDPPPPPVPDEEAKARTLHLSSDSHDQQKLSALQQQAAQWQQQKQWQEYQQSLLQYQQQLQQWNVQQASILEQINQEEGEFEVQYSEWMKQYTDWKEQNKNHPNREQFLQYEQQWKQYEEQMAQKRDYIKQRKAQALMNQSMARATSAQSFGAAEQNVLSPTSTSIHTSTFPVSASSGINSGVAYSSSSGQFMSAGPTSSTQTYPGYNSSGTNFGTGQSQVSAVERFPQQPGGYSHGAPGWPLPDMPSDPYSSTSHSTTGDTGAHVSYNYGAPRHPNSYEGMKSSFGISHDTQMRHQSPHDHSSGVARGTDFVGKVDSVQFGEENVQDNRFQHPNANAWFPGSKGPGMPQGACSYDSGSQGIPGTEGDNSALGANSASATNYKATPFGPRTDSEWWDSGGSMAQNEQAISNFMGQPRFPNQQSSEFGPGPYGSRPASMSPHGSQPMGPNSSDPNSLGLDLQHPGMSDPTWRLPVNSPNASHPPFPGQFNSRSSFTRPSGPQFPGSRMPDQFRRFDNEQMPFHSDVSQGPSHPQFSPGGRFPGPDNGMPNFQGNFNSGNTRFRGLGDPSSASDNDNEQGFGEINYHGPGRPWPRPDFRPEVEFGGPRFPGPHDSRETRNVRHQQPVPGGARFMGPRGFRMGSDVANDGPFGDSRFPGPGEHFHNSHSPNYNEDFGFERPRAPEQFGVDWGQESQLSRRNFEPRGQSGMTSDSRFQFRAPRMSKEHQPFSNDGKKPESSGPVPLLSLTGLAPSGGMRTSIFDSSGRNLHNEAAFLSFGSQASEFGQIVSRTEESETESGNSKAVDSQNDASDGGPFNSGANTRFPGGPAIRGRSSEIRGQWPVSDEMELTRWQAPTGMALESDPTEVDQHDAEAAQQMPVGFSGAGMSSGPRFPAPGSNMGRGKQPVFPGVPILPNRPQQFGVQSSRMRLDLPASVISKEGSREIFPEEQEDFSRDYGEEGFFGKRKSSEVMSEEGSETASSKFGRMEPAGQPAGFGLRGSPFDVNPSRVGAPAGMRSRFDPVSGNLVRPRGPVPLMQLSLRPPISSNADQESVTMDLSYGKEEVDEEDPETMIPDSEMGRFPPFGPRGPSGIRDRSPGQPRMTFEPRGISPSWPRPRMAEFHLGLGRGGPGNVRVPFNSLSGGMRPGLGSRRISQEEHPKEEFIGIQPPNIEYKGDGNPPNGADENWIAEECKEGLDPEDSHAAHVEETDEVEDEDVPVLFSDRQHELIKNAAEELKVLKQKQNQLEVLDSLAPPVEKPKESPSTLVPYAKDESVVADFSSVRKGSGNSGTIGITAARCNRTMNRE